MNCLNRSQDRTGVITLALKAQEACKAWLIVRILKAQLVVWIIQDILLGFIQLNFDLLYRLDCECAQHKYVFDFSFVLLHFFPFVLYIFFSQYLGYRCPKSKSSASSLQLHRFNQKPQRCIRRQKTDKLVSHLHWHYSSYLILFQCFMFFCKGRTMF